MTSQKWTAGGFPLRQSEQLLCKITRGLTVKRDIARKPFRLEYPEQEERIFQHLTEGFGLFDQEAGSIDGCLGYRRSVSYGMHQRECKPYLKLYLVATERRRGRHTSDLGKRARELIDPFRERRAFQRPLSRLAPKARSLLDQPRLGAMTR
jgi:hypothetical protein